MAPPVDPVPRAEFQGYVDRHENDDDAHGHLVRRLQTEGLNVRLAFELRVSALERWQQRIIGAGALLSFLVAAGIVAAVVELIRLAIR